MGFVMFYDQEHRLSNTKQTSSQKEEFYTVWESGIENLHVQKRKPDEVQE